MFKRKPIAFLFFFYYISSVMKTKGQHVPVAKPEPLAFRVSVSWQSGLTHPIYTRRNGVTSTVRGFESRTHRQIETPIEAPTSTGALEPHS